MSVRCPCGDKCSGYNPNRPSDCDLIETSELIPDRFKSHLIGKAAGTFADGSFWGGVFGLLGAGVTAKVLSDVTPDDTTTFEVWECPDCNCEVLYRIIKESRHFQRTKITVISTCE